VGRGCGVRWPRIAHPHVPLLRRGGRAPSGRGPAVPAPARRGCSEGALRARGPRTSRPRRGGVASLWPSRVGAALRGRHELVPGLAERPSAGGRVAVRSPNLDGDGVRLAAGWECSGRLLQVNKPCMHAWCVAVINHSISRFAYGSVLW
jgi:hypothetical protein